MNFECFSTSTLLSTALKRLVFRLVALCFCQIRDLSNAFASKIICLFRDKTRHQSRKAFRDGTRGNVLNQSHDALRTESDRSGDSITTSRWQGCDN